jgi:multidrug efflux pump
MQLTNFALSNRTAVFVLMFALALLGAFSYLTLPRESSPDIKVPFITVVVPWPEASPADVEKSVTIPLERELRDLRGLKDLSSVSSEGISITTCEFDPSITVEEALQNVRDRFDRARSSFPSDVDDETIEELSFEEFPFLIITLYGGDIRVLDRLAEELEERIEQIPGVLNVGVAGGIEPQIEIEVDPEKLEAYRLPVNNVIGLLRGENTDISAGSVDTGSIRTSVRIPGEFRTAEDVEGLIVHHVDGRPVYLREVATADRTYKDPISYARRDGKAAVQLSVQKRAGADIIPIAAMIRHGMAEAAKEFPAGVNYAILMDGSDDIRNMVSDLENNILTGLVLVLLVIFFALGLRNAIFVALAVPFSMGMAVFILQLMGLTLNMVVLFALILAQGMLVDNAIVIIENIYRHIGLGKSPLKAAREATKEVGWPVIAATATTTGAFFPMLFWPGIMGEFMFFLPATVIVVLLCSLFVALVINPTLAATFMRFHRPGTSKFKRGVEGMGYKFLEKYEAFLRAALRFPRTLMASAFVILMITVGVYAKLGHGVELFPQVEPKLAFVNITAPEGTSIERTDALTRAVEDRMPDNPDFKGVEVVVGGVGGTNPFEGGAEATHRARITMSFKDAEDRVGSPLAYLDTLRPLVVNLPGAEFEVVRQDMGPPTGAPINVEVTTEREEDLVAAMQRVRRIVEGTEGVVDVSDDLSAGRPELRITIDRQKAALLGLNTQWIGNFVKMLINGQRIGGFEERNEERDIIVRLPEKYRNDPTVLDSIRISDSQGNAIPLSTLCRWEYVGGPGTIRRKNAQRMLTITGDAAPGFTADAVLKTLEANIDRELASLPPGIQVRFAGESQDREEAAEFLSQAFVVAILLIMFILVLQFNSFAQAGIILASVILSLIGVMVSLIVLSQPFGIIMTGVAIIALAGVVVNNAIVMLDYTNQLRFKRGLSVLDAVVEAGKTRFRPVMLTAITTTLGLLPMAIQLSFDFSSFRFVAGGESSAWWQPLATAVIFGLMIATVLTLVLVPAAYIVTSRWSGKASDLFARWFGKIDELSPEQKQAKAATRTDG